MTKIWRSITKLALEKENFTVDICLDGAEGLYYMQEICMIWYFWTACFLPWMEPGLKEAKTVQHLNPCYFPYGTWRITGQSQRIELRSR